jgi:hypothetical protein
MLVHSSHLYQPLDVGCFLALKNSYRQGVSSTIRLGINHVDKPEFLSLYQQAHVQAFSLSNIHSGFAVTELVPYKLDQVLIRLQIQLQTPSLPPPPLANKEALWSTKTPHNLYRLKQ